MRRALRKGSGRRIFSICVTVSVGLLSWTFGYADDSILAQNVPVESAADKGPEMDITAPKDRETQSTLRVPTTEELIAGRGFQKLHYKGLTFAPGGYIEAAGIFLSANENGDIQSSFGNIPLHGTANSHLTEFRGTTRGSRINLLGEGTYRGLNLPAIWNLTFLVLRLMATRWRPIGGIHGCDRCGPMLIGRQAHRSSLDRLRSLPRFP